MIFNGVEHKWNTSNSIHPVLIKVILWNGTGDAFDEIEVNRIEASNTEDLSKQKGFLIPDELDSSNYEAVAEYYGFYQ